MSKTTKQMLSIEEAYRAMFCFLQEYYSRTESEEIGGMLGGLAIASDGKAMDEGMWQDWNEAVATALIDPQSARQVFIGQE